MLMVAYFARVRNFKRDQPFAWKLLWAITFAGVPVTADTGHHRRRHPVGRLHPDRGGHRRLRLCLFLGLVVYRTLTLAVPAGQL